MARRITARDLAIQVLQTTVRDARGRERYISKRAAARQLGIDERTFRRWLAGEVARPLPEHLRVLEDRATRVRRSNLEAARRQGIKIDARKVAVVPKVRATVEWQPTRKAQRISGILALQCGDERSGTYVDPETVVEFIRPFLGLRVGTIPAQVRAVYWATEIYPDEDYEADEDAEEIQRNVTPWQSIASRGEAWLRSWVEQVFEWGAPPGFVEAFYVIDPRIARREFTPRKKRKKR